MGTPSRPRVLVKEKIADSGVELLKQQGMGDMVTANLMDQPELVEKFGRAFARGHAFALDDANREAVLDHVAAGNPQESEDLEFAAALFEAVRSKTYPLVEGEGLGYMPPEVWEEWQQSLIDGGDLEAPLEDLEAAYTNDFVEVWNEGLN